MHLEEGEYVNGTNNPIDCIISVKSSGTYREFLGICTVVHEAGDKVLIGDTLKKELEIKQPSIDFATHGDFWFKVSDSSAYSVGDTVLYDGTVLDDNARITVRLSNSIVGKCTGIIDSTTIAVFKA